MAAVLAFVKLVPVSTQMRLLRYASEQLRASRLREWEAAQEF
jgi:hypothetical protein